MEIPDISRSAFDPEKHYTSVRMQQGRVIVDDDWNERERIDQERERRSLIHIIGEQGSSDDGFRIVNISDPEKTGGIIDFDICPGTFYVGGLSLELERTETYRLQSDWLNQPRDQDAVPDGERFDLVYIEAWQQSVSAVEDGELFEVALGGADTSARMRTMRRVHLAKDVGSGDCFEAWSRLIKIWKESAEGELNSQNELISNACLTVSYVQSGVQSDLCRPSVIGGYLGAENQALRVQLVDRDHLIWGIDNASSIYRVTVNGKTVTLLNEPKDQVHWPQSHHVVEILPWSARLPNGEKIAESHGSFFRVVSPFHPDKGTLEIDAEIPAGFKAWESRDDSEMLKEPSKNDPLSTGEFLYMRVWDQGLFQTQEANSGTSGPLLRFQENDWLKLGNTGVEIRISRKQENLPLRGRAYWILALRPETPTAVVPWSLEDERRPHGVRRFRAPLALIHWEGGTVKGPIRDCRRRFQPLTRMERCCSIRVGDGIRSFGDCDDLQMAIDSLPASGGEICLLQGVHNANARIKGRRKILISGCGTNTILVPHQDQLEEPIIQIVDSEEITLKSVELDSLGGTAISVVDTGEGELTARHIEIIENKILGHRAGIWVQDGSDIAIRGNKIRILDKTDGGVGIFLSGQDTVIEGNDIGVVPAESTPPDQPLDGTPPDPTDPCVELPDIYAIFPSYFIYIAHLWAFAFAEIPTNPYKALGGIQIAAGAEKVKVRDNRIRGGAGNGITLGGGELPAEHDELGAEDEQKHIIKITESHKEGTLVGLVKAEHTNEPLEGVAIVFEAKGGTQTISTVSDDIGYYRADGFTVDDYLVTAATPGLQISRIVVQSQNSKYVLYVEKKDEKPKNYFAFLEDISIENNEISGMALSGISSPGISNFKGEGAKFYYKYSSLPALKNSARSEKETSDSAKIPNPFKEMPLGSPISGLSIKNNLITGCLPFVPTESLRKEARIVGFGGVSLGICDNASIVDNRIVENGFNNDNPVCGVFIGFGEHIEISGNVIEDNAPAGAGDISEREFGIRGGILVTLSALHAYEKFPGGDFLTDSLKLGARIHGNIVRQPVGNALVILGAGSLSICNNHLVTQSAGPLPYGQAAGTFLVINHGGAPSLGSGETVIGHNQIYLGDIGNSLCVCSINCSDDLDFSNNQSVALGRARRLFNTNLSGKSLRAIGNRFKETGKQEKGGDIWSLRSWARINKTAHNQGDHCIVVQTLPTNTGNTIDVHNQVIDPTGCPKPKETDLEPEEVDATGTFEGDINLAGPTNIGF